MLSGRILTESLRVGADLKLPQLRLIRVTRADVSATSSPDQPDVFTALDVEAPDELADELAEALSAALIEGPSWYADFRVGADHVVVYPGRIFRYTIGDTAARQEAVDYGAAIGIPHHQLDWED